MDFASGSDCRLLPPTGIPVIQHDTRPATTVHLKQPFVNRVLVVDQGYVRYSERPQWLLLSRLDDARNSRPPPQNVQ